MFAKHNGSYFSAEEVSSTETDVRMETDSALTFDPLTFDPTKVQTIQKTTNTEEDRNCQPDYVSILKLTDIHTESMPDGIQNTTWPGRTIIVMPRQVAPSTQTSKSSMEAASTTHSFRTYNSQTETVFNTK